MSRRLLQMFVATRYATKTWSGSNVCRYSICDSQEIEFKCLPHPLRDGAFFRRYPWITDIFTLSTINTSLIFPIRILCRTRKSSMDRNITVLVFMPLKIAIAKAYIG